MIKKEYIDCIVIDLEKNFKKFKIENEYDWKNPSLNVIDCVLSLNRKYEEFVKPRVEQFKEKNPKCFHLKDLINLIKKHDNNYENFMNHELNYNHLYRGRIIHEVTEYLLLEIDNINNKDELNSLREWAINARPGDAFFMGIKGFGLSGFQYLRMLFGAQTTKPDVHILKYVSSVVNEKISDIQAVYILEKAAKKLKLPLRDLDSEIWKKQSRNA